MTKQDENMLKLFCKYCKNFFVTLNGKFLKKYIYTINFYNLTLANSVK